MPQITGYQLIERIGEGGMGVVYRADQLEPVRRHVALKIIRRGMDSKEILARFDAERQALAMMDHPSIATVFDAGETDDGLPFFVMELVEGAPLQEFCKKNRLDKEARLQLFMAICQAVQHAHQKGVIHRDLKPSNILIAEKDGGGPLPKIIDFGIAKAAAGGQKLTEQTLFTGFMQIVGTPAYMSPEQAEISGMDIDTRTDVYALGVILYELLTGTLPFDAKRFHRTTLAEIERILWEEDPPAPSKRLASLDDATLTAVSGSLGTTPRRLQSEVAGELDWIVMKALEKDRGRRYGSAADFAEDLRRHLDNEPVAASPPSRLYLVRKFVRRHRLGIGTAAALAAMLIAGTAVSLWQASKARVAAAEAEEAREDAERESAAAKQNLRINDRIIYYLMNDMIEAGNPLKEPDRDIKLRTILDRGAAKLDETFDEERDIRFALSMTLGRMYSVLGELGEARRLLETANALGDDLWPTEDNRMVAGVKNALGTVEFREGNYEKAQQLFEISTSMLERIEGPQDEYIYGKMSLAYTLQGQQRFEEAKEMMLELLGPCEQFAGENSLRTINLLSLIGEVCKSLGQDEGAKHYFDESQRRYAMRGGAEEALDPTAIDARSNQAVVLMNQGKFDEAIPLLREVVDYSSQAQGAEHPLTLTSLHNLAAAHFKLGQHEEAQPYYRRVVDGEMKVLGEEHLNTRDSLRVYAINSMRIPSEQENGIEAMKRLLHIEHRLVGDNSGPLQFSFSGLSRFLPEMGREQELAEIEAELTGDVDWPAQSTQTLVPRGASWRYYDGADPDAAFAGAGFDDGAWERGGAPLGYGDSLLATTIGFGDDPDNKHRAAWFRHAFEVDDPSAIKELKIRLRYDDLAEIYLNGQRLAAGEEGRNSDRLAEQLYYVLLAQPSALTAGENVLAVEIRQAEPDSSDLIFDLQLEALVE